MQKTSHTKTNSFLEAEWRKLLMINYAVDQQLLQPYLPHQTVIDLWNGVCYISLVGFMFLNTKVKGFKIPFHINFEEVNLRFYVRYKDKNEWKRGVVFIKEIVPKPALTFVANTLYKEHYETLPMQHQWLSEADSQFVGYKWKKKGEWNEINVQTSLNQSDIAPGSEAAFITEHYWGYTRINAHKTSEYEVVHPLWKVYQTLDYSVHVNFHDTYGQDFGFLEDAEPKSVFLAEGSAIEVKSGKLIT